MTSNYTIDDYVNMPHAIQLVRNSDGTYFAEIPDLPGCMTEGDTPEEALEMIIDAKRAWVATALELGREVPLPEEEKEYSGKFVVRVPSSLHRDLAHLAEREGVSLNQMVLTLLSKNLTLSSLEKQEDMLKDIADKVSIVAEARRTTYHASGSKSHHMTGHFRGRECNSYAAGKTKARCQMKSETIRKHETAR